MKIEVWAGGDKTGDLAAAFQSPDHVGSACVCQAIAIVGEEDVLILNETFDRHEPLANIVRNASIDHCDAPVRCRLTHNLHRPAEAGGDAVFVGSRLQI